ncbi:MAG: hypothetical protein HY873_01390 [Chloroflexi bacterium]|nr:hypothetical protein [Chloroflexota bacterium]
MPQIDAARQARQLALIAQIAAALDEATVSWWLFGGWAMDAHAGRITRAHDDIEVFVWERDAAAVRTALSSAGFFAPPGLYPGECQPFLKDSEEVGAWYLVRETDSRVHTPGRWSDWPWPKGSFDGPRVDLAGLLVPAMSLEGLLEMKLKFRDHPHGAPPREKDLADIDLLQRLMSASG